LQHEIDHLNGILFYDKINKDISPNKLSQWIRY
jgi:peptide deformylase